MWPFSPFSSFSFVASVVDPWTGRRDGVHLAKPGKLKIGANVKPSREAESSPSFDAAGLHGIVMGSSLDVWICGFTRKPFFIVDLRFQEKIVS